MKTPSPSRYSICPCCRKHFGPVFSDIIYQVRNGHDTMFILLCANCQIRYFSADGSERNKMRTTGISAIASSPSDPWACVSLFALSLNGGDLDRAIENGLGGMDRTTYDVLAHTHELSNFMHPALALSFEALADSVPARNATTQKRQAIPQSTKGE